MKPRWIVTLVIALIALVAVWQRHRPTADAPDTGTAISAPVSPDTTRAPEASALVLTPPTASTSDPPTAPPSSKVASANVPAPVQPATSLPPPVIPVPEPSPPVEQLRDEIDNVQFALRDYRSVLGENPIGTNAEITKALLGDNLKQVKIPVPSGSSVNADGEMCDRWGTPYFFHQLSGKQMEIHSAGPDRKLGTSDDLVVK